MRSIARILSATIALALLFLASPARAQQQPNQPPAAAGIPKFKDAALQQYLVTELSTIEEKLDKLSARLEAMESQMAKLREQQQALAADFRTNQDLAKATDTSVTSLRASNQEDLLSLKSDVARIRRDLADLNDDVRRSAAPPAAAAPTQPKVEGYITQATSTSMIINLGSAAGIEVGMKFGVYRAAEPQTRIGTVEVTEVVDANNSRVKTVASNPNTKFQFSDIVRPY